MSDTELDEAAGPSIPRLILPAEEPEIPAAVPAGLQDKLQSLRSTIKSDLSGRQLSASLCSPRFSERPLSSPRSNSSACASPRSARGLSSFGFESRQETPRALFKASIRKQLGTGTPSPEPQQAPSSAGRRSSELPEGLGQCLPEPRFQAAASSSPAAAESPQDPPRPLLQAFLQLPTFESYCNTRRAARLNSLPSRADRAAAAAATSVAAEQLAGMKLQGAGSGSGAPTSWQPRGNPSSNISPSGFSSWGMEGGAASSSSASRPLSPASWQRQQQQQEGSGLAELARAKRANISLAPTPAAGTRRSSNGGNPSSPGPRHSSGGWGPAVNLRPPSPARGAAAGPSAATPGGGSAMSTQRTGLAALELTRHATSSSSNTLKRLGSRPASPSAAAAPRVPGSPGAGSRYASSSSSSWGASIGILSAQQQHHQQQRRMGAPASSRPVALAPSPASQLNIRPPVTSVTRLRSAAVTEGVQGVTRTKPGPELQQLQVVVVQEYRAGDAAATAAEEAAAVAAGFGVAPWGPADVLLCSPHSPGIPGIQGVHYSPWPLQLSAADAAAVQQAAFAVAGDSCSGAKQGASCGAGFDAGAHAADQLSMLDNGTADGSRSAPDSPARQRLLRQDSASSPGHHERHRKLAQNLVTDAVTPPAPNGALEHTPQPWECPQGQEPAKQQQLQQVEVGGGEPEATPVHMQHASGTWLEGGLLGSSISRSREAPRLEPMQLLSPYSSTTSALFSRQGSQQQQQRPPSRGLLLDPRAPGSSSGSRRDTSLWGAAASTTPGGWLSMTSGPSLGSSTGYGNRSGSSRNLLEGGASLLQGTGGAAGASSSTPSGYFSRTAPPRSAAGSSRSASPALVQLESGVWARSMRSREPDAGQQQAGGSGSGGWFSSTGTRSQSRQGGQSTAPAAAGVWEAPREEQDCSVAAASSGHAGASGRPGATAAFWSAPGDMNSLSRGSSAGTRGAAIAAACEAAASSSQGPPAGLSSTGYGHSSSGRNKGSSLGYLDAQLRQLSSPKTSFGRSGLNLSLQPRSNDVGAQQPPSDVRQQQQQQQQQQPQQQQQQQEQEENIYITLLPPPAYAHSQDSTASEVEGGGEDQAQQEDWMQEAARGAAAPCLGVSQGRVSGNTSLVLAPSSSTSSAAHLFGSSIRGQGPSGVGAASAAVAAALGTEGRESTAGAAADALLSNSGAPHASGSAASGSRCHRQHQLQQAAAAAGAPGTTSHPASSSGSRVRHRSSSVVAAAAEAAKVLADEEEAGDVDKRAMHAYLCNRFVRQRQGRIMCRVLTAWWRLSTGRVGHERRRSSKRAMQVAATSPTKGSLQLSDAPAGLTLDCSAVCRPVTASGAPGDEFHLSGTAVLRLVCSPGPGPAPSAAAAQQLASRGAAGGDDTCSDASTSDMGDSPSENELVAMLQDRQGQGVGSSRPGSVAWAGLLPGQGISSQAGSPSRAPGSPTKQLRLLQQVQEMINHMEDIVSADEPTTDVLVPAANTAAGARQQPQQQRAAQPQGRRPGSAAAAPGGSGSPVRGTWTEPAASTDGSKGTKGPLPSSPGASGRRLTQTALQQRLKHIQARVGTIELKMLQAAALADAPSYGNSSKYVGSKGQPGQRASSKQQQLVVRMQEEMAALEQELLQMQAEVPRVYG